MSKEDSDATGLRLDAGGLAGALGAAAGRIVSESGRVGVRAGSGSAGAEVGVWPRFGRSCRGDVLGRSGVTTCLRRPISGVPRASRRAPVPLSFTVPSGKAARGRLPEWPKGAVCKTVGLAYVGSNPTPATTCGNSPWPAHMRPGADLVSGWPCAAGSCHMRVAVPNTCPSLAGSADGDLLLTESRVASVIPSLENARRVGRRGHVHASASRQAGHGPASGSQRSGLLGPASPACTPSGRRCRWR
jgi:hypothetical protein